MPEDRSVEDRLKEAIIAQLGLQLEPNALPDDLPLIEKGLGLDSVSILQLVGAIEETFEIEIDDGEIRRELFCDIGSLGGYVRGKLGSA